MNEISGKKPINISRVKIDPISGLKKTLREHYVEKRKRFRLDNPNFYQRDLNRLFKSSAHTQSNIKASQFIRTIRKEVCSEVSKWTSAYQYTINRIVHDMIEACDEQKLRLVSSEKQAKLDFSIILAVHTMNYLHSGRHRVYL